MYMSVEKKYRLFSRMYDSASLSVRSCPFSVFTQKDFSGLIGISRQSLIELEHQNRKITRPVLIAIVSYFSLHKETAIILYNYGLYNNEYIQLLGFNPDLIGRIYKIKKEQNLNG